MPEATRPAIVQSDLHDVEKFTQEFLKRLQFGQGVALARATKNDLYYALARTVRQQLMSRWLETLGAQMQRKAKVVAFYDLGALRGYVKQTPDSNYAWAISGRLVINAAGNYDLCITSDDGYVLDTNT